MNTPENERSVLKSETTGEASGGRRKPGSDLGRLAIDREEAFIYYASLPRRKRSYRAVAEEFTVSVRTVEKYGRDGKWKQRVRQIDEQAAAETNRSLADARVEHIRRLRQLIGDSLAAYEDKLTLGEMRMSPADLERLHRLYGEVLEEAGEPAEQSELSVHVPERPPEHTAAVVEALRESGALEALGLYHVQPIADEQEEAS